MGNIIIAIKVLYKVIVWIFRYLITLPFLSTALLLRTNIGKRAFLPWSMSVFTIDPKQRDFTAKPMRYLSIILLYVWVRGFMVAYIISQSDVDLTQEGALPLFLEYLGGIFIDYETLLALYDHPEAMTFMENYPISIPYLFSYYIVVLGIAHLLSHDIKKHRMTSIPNYMGDSLIFGWLRKYGVGDIFIWMILEPLLLLLIGFLVKNNGYDIYAWFFWIAAASTAFLGYERREAAKDMQELMGASRKKAKTITKMAPAKTEDKNEAQGSKGPTILN